MTHLKTWLKLELQKTIQQIYSLEFEVVITALTDRSKGDYATPVALGLGRKLQRKPLEIAKELAAAIPPSPQLESVEVAAPGFINFVCSAEYYRDLVQEICTTKELITQTQNPHKLLIEFVSANPTGPLHVGHGRGAVIGDTLARIYKALGHKVETEYYVNDAGRQMDILATSVYLRAVEACCNIDFPKGLYQGSYIKDLSHSLPTKFPENISDTLKSCLTKKPNQEEDAFVDALIARVKQELGSESYQQIYNFALESMLEIISKDVASLGIVYDSWFSEASLATGSPSLLEESLENLAKAGKTFEKDEALWFASSEYGDEKDRVLKRSEAQSYTYFASDVAYHHHKFKRGYDTLINIWGSDHHGYIKRVKASVEALGHNPQNLVIELVQFALLLKNEEKISMSTRSGSFIPLIDLVNEVGKDALRYFYSEKKCDNHLEIDIELLQKQSQENPLYYIQYAHARICSLFEKAGDWQQPTIPIPQQLEAQHKDLILLLTQYNEYLASACKKNAVHLLCVYLYKLAESFHGFYSKSSILQAKTHEEKLWGLYLARATQKILASGLEILGIEPKKRM